MWTLNTADPQLAGRVCRLHISDLPTECVNDKACLLCIMFMGGLSLNEKQSGYYYFAIVLLTALNTLRQNCIIRSYM